MILSVIIRKISGKKDYSIKQIDNVITIQKTKTKILNSIVIGGYVLLLLMLFTFFAGQNDSNAYFIMPIFIIALTGMIYMSYRDWIKEPKVEFSSDKISFFYKKSTNIFEKVKATELVFHHSPQAGKSAQYSSVGIIIQGKEFIIAYSDSKKEMKYLNKILHTETKLETLYQVDRGILDPIIKKVSYVE